jgi:hypothetical protein
MLDQSEQIHQLRRFETEKLNPNNNLLLGFPFVIGKEGYSMRWLLIGIGLTLTPGVWGTAAQTPQEQIEEIDAQIKELKDMKRGYEARAIRAEDQADRLQFEDHYVLETRRYYRIAEENRMKAQKVQEEIDRLEMRKAKLEK